MNDRYNILIESRLTKLETIIENHQKLFADFEQRSIRIEHKIDQHFLWTIGLIVGSILIPYVNAYLRSKGIPV